jgi:magnesium transporter
VTIVNCAAYANGRRVEDIEISAIRVVLRQPEHFIWIGLHEPGEEVLKQIQQEFDLHDLAIEDAHSAHERPKIEMYGDSLFLVLRTAQMNRLEHRIDFGETHIFFGARYIVSVRHGSSLTYADIRKRCESTPHLLRKGPVFALYALMDFIVDQYQPIVDSLQQELLTLEEKIFNESFSRETTMQLYHLQRDLLEVKQAVSPLINICNRLTHFDLELIPAETRPYFRDIYDHVIHINELVDSLRAMLDTALQANFALISIAQNEVMKRFAGWAAIIALPTMIAGIYGMNFQGMPELGWSYGYPIVLAVIVGASVFLYVQFKRSGWI